MDTVRCEEYQASLTWIPADRAVPYRKVWLWIQTRSGIVATGYHDGAFWCTDGGRVKDAEDLVIRWAEIEYPEGPVFIP
jgi:elongation factor P hydroxylase